MSNSIVLMSAACILQFNIWVARLFILDVFIYVECMRQSVRDFKLCATVREGQYMSSFKIQFKTFWLGSWYADSYAI